MAGVKRAKDGTEPPWGNTGVGRVRVEGLGFRVLVILLSYSPFILMP